MADEPPTPEDARKRLQALGVDPGPLCPECSFPPTETRPAHGEAPKPVTCANCQTTFTLAPHPAPPPPPRADRVMEVVNRCVMPVQASQMALQALHTFINGGGPEHLHNGVLYLARCCELLASGQRQLGKEVVDLNFRLPDLDTPADPVAPPAPGVEPSKRDALPTATKTTLAAEAQRKLRPSESEDA